MGADKENMRKLQETYAEAAITEMTKLMKARARMVRDLEEKEFHISHKHKLFVSEKKGSRDIRGK